MRSSKSGVEVKVLICEREIEKKINASPLKRGPDQGIQGDDPAQ